MPRGSSGIRRSGPGASLRRSRAASVGDAPTGADDDTARLIPGATRTGIVRDSGVLLGAQLLFNVGFYAVVPFIALVLTDDFALGGGAVGLVLGVRTFSQQGMFLLGGILADRFGARTVILLGCGVRCLGFMTLSASLWSTQPSLAWFVVGTVLTGLGGALFSPALNTLVASAEARRGAAGGRRATLFAWLTVIGEIGAATGPLVGAALLGWGFSTVAATGAALFAAIAAVLWRALSREGSPPPRATGLEAEDRRRGHGTDGRAADQAAGRAADRADGRTTDRTAGRHALRDRGFLAFAAIHAVDLLAYNQLYLSVPAEVRRVGEGATALALVFAWVSVLTVALQLPLARWSSRIGAPAALRAGYLSSATGFLVLACAAPWRPIPGFELLPVFAAASFVTVGHLLASPTALSIVPRFAGRSPTGSYFGLLATLGGIAVLVGGLTVGSLLDAAVGGSAPVALPWLVLATLPVVSAVLVGRRAKPRRAV